MVVNGTDKKEEVVNVFRKGKYELLALTETKLKRNGEASLPVFRRLKELEKGGPSC